MSCIAGGAALESSPTVRWKVKHALPHDRQCHSTGVCAQEKRKHMFLWRLVRGRQEMSSRGRPTADEPISSVVHPYSGILPGHKKDWGSDPSHQVSAPGTPI